MAHLGLRLRIFLFFALMAAGAIALAAGAMGFAWSRADPDLPAAPFITAGIVFALLNTGLLLAIWLLFDDNVAKPINRLSADLRMRVHADTREDLETAPARYLGDLGPAAAALTRKAETGVEATAAQIARETQRLSDEHKRLTALLTESPVATILINPAREIVLYDAQAAALLAQTAPPRLKAPLSDFFDADTLNTALTDTGEAEVARHILPIGAVHPVKTRIRALNGDGHILFFDPADIPTATSSARPLVFDFALLHAGQGGQMADRPLSELCFVVLDLETTGLSVTRDKIVQIGAVRVLNGTRIPGEIVSTYVDPQEPIPPAATRIHHVCDADVAGAPTVDLAGQALHQFCSDAVLVAHNAPFDIGMLKAQVPAKAWDHPVLDTVLLSAVVFGTNEDHTLDTLCDRLGVVIPEAERHTALGDARATADALICLLKMLQGRGFETLAALQDATEREARRLYARS